ncbi:MAG TPA: 3-oxoacyl-ACP reductase family protein, partial [Bryobacteraceae bacterium]|nr:3-oxoacyl-ACP reductase family protein [Bryobacteraceae bacterium]
MPLPLAGKHALVTGASKGIGKGIALELARQGAAVAVNYHSDSAGGAGTAAEIRALGADAFSLGGDVSQVSDVEAMFSQVFEHFGRLDILVNNAGTQVFKPLLELAEQDWDRVIDTNLKGCFLCTQHAARHMRDHGGGRIVNIGSGCNKVPFPGLVSYTASKGGIEMFTKVAAVELGPFGITVNCVAPGAIEIERTKHEAGDYAGTWSKLTPIPRIGLPEDVAHTVAYLAS